MCWYFAALQTVLDVFMPQPPDSVGEGITFSVDPSAAFVCLLPRNLMNAVNNFDKNDRECSLAHSDNLIRFWRSEVKVTADCRAGKGIHVDAGPSSSVFRFWIMQVEFMSS